MSKQSLLILIFAVLILGGGAMLFSGSGPDTDLAAVQGRDGQMAGADLPPLDEQWDIIYDYCISCHNEFDYTGGLSLEYALPEFVHEEGEIWEKAIIKLGVGQMPPLGEPQPTEQQRETFVNSLIAVLDEQARENPNPGTPVLPRLNRTEYQNAIRDLLHLDIDASSMLLADDSAEGFDNMSTALQVSPTLLEGYVAASGTVAAKAVGDPTMPPDFAVYRAPQDGTQNKRLPGAPIGTVGGVVFEHYFPLDGEYEISPKIFRTVQTEARGIEFANTLEISIDKERVHIAEFGGYKDTEQRSFELGVGANSFELAQEIDERFKTTIFMTAGMHSVSVNFLKKPESPDPEIWKQHKRTSLDRDVLKGPPHLDKVEIRGPFNVAGTGETPSRQKIFSCQPVFEDEELPCATEILSRLAREAYRRPVAETEVSDLLNFFELGREIGGFEKGIETGIRRIISGPEFLFRAEEVPAGVEPGTAYRISDLDLASRLSFFLWSSIPDEELLNLAIAEQLSDPDVLEAQVMRMLQDPKAENLTTNFASQWLTLRNLNSIVPDPALFPDYNDNLRQSSIRETQMLFSSIVEEDRNIIDLIDADYTYINEHLADLYGIDDIFGTRMRRVPVMQEERRGILGHSSIQTLTSLSIRTSPVTRGKWFLVNIINTPPPEPPGDVDTDLTKQETGEPQTLRDLLELHRSDPVCSSCHTLMDTIGFTLENFDAVGRYRVEDNGKTLDTTGTLFDGTPIENVNGIRQWLLDNEDVFVNAFTEKLMQFALARPVQYYDKPAVREIVRSARQNDNRFSSIVLGIVNSVPFQMRMNGSEASDSVALSE